MFVIPALLKQRENIHKFKTAVMLKHMVKLSAERQTAGFMPMTLLLRR